MSDTRIVTRKNILIVEWQYAQCVHNTYSARTMYCADLETSASTESYVSTSITQQINDGSSIFCVSGECVFCLYSTAFKVVNVQFSLVGWNPPSAREGLWRKKPRFSNLHHTRRTVFLLSCKWSIIMFSAMRWVAKYNFCFRSCYTS